MTLSIQWLGDDPRIFPHHDLAFTEPNGLLAAGGDLCAKRILNAYSLGIFPWYSKGEPILWWSPNPRCIIYPLDFKPSKSLAKLIRKNTYTVTFDQCFEQVIENCSLPRRQQVDTWISSEIKQAYMDLHEQGYAHSVECWSENKLIGGLYGLSIGKVFFGESMFSFKSNASKVAFATLVNHINCHNFDLIDCQVHNEHLESLGAIEIPRSEFLNKLNEGILKPDLNTWKTA